MIVDLKSQAKLGLNLNIHRLNFIINDITNKKLKETGFKLTNSQYLILKCIFLLEAPSQKSIAEYLKISSAAVSRHCDLLKEKRYIEIQEVSKREHVISLTKKGKMIFEKSLILLNSEIRKKIRDYDKLSNILYSVIQKD